MDNIVDIIVKAISFLPQIGDNISQILVKVTPGLGPVGFSGLLLAAAGFISWLFMFEEL